MKVLVTGVAGFIGSHLAENLAAEGCDVLGVDSFSDYYAREIKENNLESLRKNKHFRFTEKKIRDAVRDGGLLDGVEAVFHLAAQPGVRKSWGKSFSVYIEDNIASTQALLEALKDGKIKKLVYASSSSIYGDAETFPTGEDIAPRPVSPYGITKLAAEHLCALYWKSFGVPAVALRYFTVYGPRQRPDMAFSRLFAAAEAGEAFQVFGDGEQTRDFTFVGDIVKCNMLAMEKGEPGEVFNVGGGHRVTMNEVFRIAEKLLGKPLRLNHIDTQRGDARHTSADITKAKEKLGFSPSVTIEEGLKKQLEAQNLFSV